MAASPSPASAPTKICIVCGKDCSTVDRLKDAEGRYTCKTCADAKGGRAAPDIASLYERPESRPCPQCDKPVPHDAEICVACGYNLRAGKPVKTKLGKLDPSSAGRRQATMESRQKPRRWLIAAIIGGTAGAGAWVGAAYALSEPAAWMGIVVGVVTGGAVFLASREFAAGRSALYALIFALLMGVIGKGGSAVLLTLTLGPVHPGEVSLDAVAAKGQYAREVAKELADQGKTFYWPSGFSLENARAQEHYPPEIWQEMSTRWETSGPGWQQQYRAAKQAQLQVEADEKFAADRAEAFLGYFDWWDAIYGGIGLVLAGTLGAGVLNLIKRS
ncbi:MAG: hypothetical protein AB7K52_09760 [Phycisphaerales bacterium]